jgi:hypothetical protein
MPITTSILKSSFQEDQIIAGNDIPGVQFKNKPLLSPKKVSTIVASKTTASSLQKSMNRLSTMPKKLSYLHTGKILSI